MNEKEDKVYADPIAPLPAFEFNAQVADVFENMIERSVPGYRLALDTIALLTERYAQPETNCYDLGCSLGAATLRIRQQLPASCHVIGVDISKDMVARCLTNVGRDHSQATIEIRLQDLRDTQIKNASVVVLNFTLQFVPDVDRDQVLKRISDGLNDNGVMVLCEKISFDDSEEQRLLETLYYDFKRLNGYSDLEIAQKRAALENVLVPNTCAALRQRALEAGFKRVDTIMQCLNFVALLATK
jgi:tRNA (cmo5U34)-methyltransferase